jgi:hypothetical protein
LIQGAPYLAPEANISTVRAWVKKEITREKMATDTTLAKIRPTKLDMSGSTTVGTNMIPD